MLRWLASCVLLLSATVVATQAPPRADTDAAFARFFAARTDAELAAAQSTVIASAIPFDEAFTRLRRGRPYRADVPRGTVQGSYRDGAAEYFYTLEIPESYDPARSYQVRMQLHGGVGRIEQSRPAATAPSGRLAGAEQIYVYPYAWRDAPWWSARQTTNLDTILDLVKRSYNVDENRVVLSGVSDGGTGVYFMAMRDTTPFASFLPLNGFVMVLRNEMAEAEGDLFPNNLRNKPLFIVNGGRDPQYPTSLVDPYITHLQSGGVDVVYKPQPNAAHDTSWWPEVKDTFEQFVREHPRKPLPDALTWESGEMPARAHWLVINRLGAASSDASTLPDLNRLSTPPALDFGIRSSGARINRVVKGSNAEQVKLEAGDTVTAINNQTVGFETDVADVLHAFPAGRPLLLTVNRGGQSVRLTGRYAPTVLPGESEAMFPPERPSGRVDLARTGNRVEVKTRGVAAFTLLLSPDQFDFDRPVTVSVNGKVVVERTVRRDVATLLKWAGRDNDRTMLFGAELTIDVP